MDKGATKPSALATRARKNSDIVNKLVDAFESLQRGMRPLNDRGFVRDVFVKEYINGEFGSAKRILKELLRAAPRGTVKAAISANMKLLEKFMREGRTG